MRGTITLAAGLLLAAAAAPATAVEDHQGLYAGLGIESFKLTVDGNVDGNALNIDTRPLGLTGRLGWNLLSWFAIEGFASTGIHDDPNEGQFGNGDDVRNGKTELKLAYGGALRPNYTFTLGEAATFTLYGLLGYSAYEFEGEVRSANALGAPRRASFSIDDNSEFYGAGLQLEGGPAALTLQYVQYADQNEHEIRALQFGVLKYF